MKNSAAFGEGLQLVNILKDSSDDARCGRAYLPPNVPIDDVYELAFDDLQRAETYIQDTLRTAEAPGGYIAFCDAPVQLSESHVVSGPRKWTGQQSTSRTNIRVCFTKSCSVRECCENNSQQGSR